MNVLILYDSWFGNTQIAAENIAEGVREAKSAQVEIRRINRIPDGEILEFDAVLIGSPNHRGRPTKATVHQIRRLRNMDTKGLKFGVFDTCFSSQMGIASGKMATQIRASAPKVEMLSPELSIVVEGYSGPIGEGELVRCREFGARLAGTPLTTPSRAAWQRA